MAFLAQGHLGNKINKCKGQPSKYTYIWGTFSHLNFQRLETIFTRTCLRNSVCLSSLCNVRAPYSAGWHLQHSFYTILYPSSPLTYMQNLRRSAEGNPSVGVKRKRGSQTERTLYMSKASLYLGNGARYGLGYNYWLIENHTRRIQWYHSEPCRVTPNKGSRPPIWAKCLYLWS